VKLVFNPFTKTFDWIDDVEVDSYFKENGNALELWWKGSLVHSWTSVPAAPAIGSPMGMLAGITYAE
jgi:hypothetical protein